MVEVDWGPERNIGATGGTGGAGRGSAGDLLVGVIGQVGVGFEIGLLGQVVDHLEAERFGIELEALDPLALDPGAMPARSHCRFSGSAYDSRRLRCRR